jgi:hypothetical protein
MNCLGGKKNATLTIILEIFDLKRLAKTKQEKNKNIY